MLPSTASPATPYVSPCLVLAKALVAFPSYYHHRASPPNILLTFGT